MQYILTLWLLWAGGDYRILQVSPFISEQACIKYAATFIEQTKADGIVASHWQCKLERNQDV